MSPALTPREIVQELDKHIVGQTAAKRAVAIALRNRWRRMQVGEELRQEITPKNILMIGPTGVGKTEIARRLAKLANLKKLRSLAVGCFVDFDFQQSGISVRQRMFPIVRMDWVEGDTLGVWLDKRFDDKRALEQARTDFVAIACFLEREGIAHGDIQNGNVMVANGAIKLIDYDGMFVPGMRRGNGSETGHKHPASRSAGFPFRS